jgi:RES domain
VTRKSRHSWRQISRVAKLPEPPPIATFTRIPPAVATLPAGTKLWRIYFRDGSYPATWDQMRCYGPVGSARFDHHLDPPSVQDRGILYAADGDDAIATCLAEVFQDTRFVDTRRNEPRLAAFALARDVSLLDLSGKWPTVAEASANINSGPRPRCRRWSRTIYDAYPKFMGLYYASSMNDNVPAVALYERASKAIPRLGLFNKLLSDATLLLPLENKAAELGYDLI